MLTRKLFKALLSEKSNKKISIILGPRQVGKTTLLKQLFQKICNKNMGIYLDLDILSNFEKVSNYENFINFITLEGYSNPQKSFFYLFLDEFQRYPGFSKILKNIYDNHDNIKIYATGSSSIKIKDEIQESLAGRKNIHYLFPLDFEEFIIFKNNRKALQQLKNTNKLKGEKIDIPLLFNLLKEFMVFGGYPEVVLNSDKEEKIKILNSIFDLYVKKDLIEFLNIKRLLNVKKLIEILSVNHGQKIKYEELGKTCSLKEYEIKNYIKILQETFLITELRPYFTNKNKEIVKIPKIYFLDSGVRNYFLNNFNEIDKRQDSGFLFEGFVISEFYKAGNTNIKYWQDKNKREVDIIIDKIHEQIPVEVKFKRKIKQNDFIGLKAFIKQYPETQRIFLINPIAQYTESINNINVILPYLTGKLK